MRIFFAIISLTFLSLISLARNAADDYETLSALPSLQLLEEGRHYFETREPEKALSRFLIVGERSKDSKDKEEAKLGARALNNAGCVFKYFYYDYPQAYEYLNRSYSLCEEIEYNEFLPVVMVNIGDVLSDYGTAYQSETVLKEAEKIFEECFRKSVETKDWNLLTTTFFNISNLNYDLNLADYKAIFSTGIPSDTPDIEYVRLQYKGIESMQRGDYSTARKHFERQLGEITTPWEASRDTISTYLNIAETYRRELNFNDAVESLEKALLISEQSDNIELSAYITNQLAQCYASLKDTVNEEKYERNYLSLREKLNASRLSNIGELKYISDLRKEETKARKIARRNREFTFMIIAMSMIILTILISTILIWRKNRDLRSRNQALYDKYQLLLRSESNPKTIKQNAANLNDTKRETLLKRIAEIMEDPQYICSPDFSSKQLAALVESNTTYVSKVINEAYGISFTTLLGNSRVKLACRRITDDPASLNLTIEAIAQSVGFKSRTAFLNSFKREVGLTPSQFIKLASKEQQLSDKSPDTEE